MEMEGRRQLWTLNGQVRAAKGSAQAPHRAPCKIPTNARVQMRRTRRNRADAPIHCHRECQRHPARCVKAVLMVFVRKCSWNEAQLAPKHNLCTMPAGLCQRCLVGEREPCNQTAKYAGICRKCLVGEREPCNQTAKYALK